MKAGINDTLLPDPFLRPALSHKLIDIRDGNNNKPLIVLHAGDLHLYVIERILYFLPFVLFPLSSFVLFLILLLFPAIGHLEHFGL